MIKDITIGQYLPMDSYIHKLDPRTKLIISVLYMIILFVCNSLLEFVIPFIYLALIINMSNIKFRFILKSVKPIIFILLFTVSLNIFMTPGSHMIFKYGILKITIEGILFALVTATRIILLVVSASMLTYTTSPVQLTYSIESIMKPLEKINMPVHEIAMMLNIALRFIPTLIEETDKIIKAQKSRGADIDTGKFRERIKSTIPILIPLFISSFRRADELAVAMESRCYRGGEGRTKMNNLKYSKCDFVTYLISITIFISIISIKIIF